jgi:thiol:disulfide interchange protein/DsbC/DsbD-like thiol-disulfide interchange protein
LRVTLGGCAAPTPALPTRRKDGGGWASVVGRVGVLALLFAPVAARAVESAPVTASHSTASLVSEADSVAAGRALRVGLRLKIEDGWHTYWVNPGDAGDTASLEVTGAQAGALAFPAPERVVDGGFTSFVLTHEVLLPAVVAHPGAGPLHLSAHATWLVCAKVCVPQEGQFALDLPAGTGAPGVDAGAFKVADAAVPRVSPFVARVSADGRLRLEAPGVAPRSVWFFPNEPGVIDHGAAQPFSVDAGGVAVKLSPVKALAGPLGGVLELVDQGGRMEALQVVAAPGAVAAAGGAPGLARVLGLAFLGGLILNLMPCVLPVLAMKALALSRLSGAARGRIREEAGLYTLGVLVAFAVIGGVTLAAKAAGASAGWGVQFQSPLFAGAMAWLMLAIGLNFSGLYEIGVGLTGVGGGLAARSSFFTGLLAVVLATPCTAPFMATALAATLVLPAAAAMAVFLALGAGLAAPYALLAVAPGLAGMLPRPGAWMVRLKQALAVPMYGAAAWLGWVVWHQAGGEGFAAVLVGGALVVAASVLWGRHQRVGRGRVPALGAVLAAVIVLLVLGVRAPQAAPMQLAAGSEPYSAGRLEALRAAHRPVLVDMSAAWCITCLVNERVALSPGTVRAAFARHGVAYLVGDWTRRDAGVTAYLQSFGRDGVPLYVWYPAEGEPVVLPQILTEADVIARVGG